MISTVNCLISCKMVLTCVMFLLVQVGFKILSLRKKSLSLGLNFETYFQFQFILECDKLEWKNFPETHYYPFLETLCILVKMTQYFKRLTGSNVSNWFKDRNESQAQIVHVVQGFNYVRDEISHGLKQFNQFGSNGSKVEMVPGFKFSKD